MENIEAPEMNRSKLNVAEEEAQGSASASGSVVCNCCSFVLLCSYSIGMPGPSLFLQVTTKLSRCSAV